jgi:hypothetical protein
VVGLTHGREDLRRLELSVARRSILIVWRYYSRGIVVRRSRFFGSVFGGSVRSFVVYYPIPALAAIPNSNPSVNAFLWVLIAQV